MPTKVFAHSYFSADIGSMQAADPPAQVRPPGDEHERFSIRSPACGTSAATSLSCQHTHPIAPMEEMIRKAGFDLSNRRETWMWSVESTHGATDEQLQLLVNTLESVYPRFRKET